MFQHCLRLADQRSGYTKNYEKNQEFPACNNGGFEEASARSNPLFLPERCEQEAEGEEERLVESSVHVGLSKENIQAFLRRL
jgi:hypothetical protein